MFTQNCLALRLVRLKPTDEWLNKGGELSFVFPQKGVGKYLSGTITHSLASGDVLVLKGTSGGKVSVANDGELAFWYFDASLEHLFPLFATNEISLLRNVTENFNRTRQYPASSALAKQCHRLLADAPPQFDLDHRSQLLRVVAAILAVEFKDLQNQRGGFVRMEAHMIQVFEKLSSDEILTLSVGELARKFSCSRRHLNRLFHQHFGFSVASLRMEMRLLKAVSLLREPDTKIINVAEGCGFNHLGLFNTCFKRRFGKSPGEWRKMNGSAEVPGRVAEGCFANHLRTKGSIPWNGKIEEDPSLPKAEPSARKAALTIVVKNDASPDEGKAERSEVPRKAREGVRRQQAI
jgi:AraC-like DNA-binding protein